MWNPFRKKKNLGKNAIDEMARKFASENRFHELDVALQKVNVCDLNIKELETYYHLRGMSAFQKNDHQASEKYYIEGLTHVADSQTLMFSLGQAYVYLKQPLKAFEWFDRCHFPKVSREYVLTMSRYAYLYNEYERGIRYIDQFFSYYLNLKILDDQFLYARGLPFFNLCWDHLAVHCLLGDKIEILKEKSKEIEKRCVSYDFDYLECSLSAYTDHHYDDLINMIERTIKEAKNSKLPTLYNDLRISCLKATSIMSYEEAMTVLDEKLTSIMNKKNFENIILLAKSAVANKFDQQKVESAYMNEFMIQQPLLLEPEVALEFGLLFYQDRIKKLFIL